ncbi:MAG: M28 family peptidase [Gemmatimonadaceae bacterium]
MHRSVLLLAVFAACAPATSTVTSPAPASPVPISVTELRRDLFAFSADSMAGRETGTPSELRAARFLVDRLVSLGIEPGGDSLYYQRVPLIKESFGPGTQLAVTQGPNTIPLGLGREILPWVNLGAGAPLPKRSAEGEIFFAGYGMVGPGRNDFQGLDAPGRVIVIIHAAPPNVTDSATREQLESQEELGQRMGRALQFQPAAVVALMAGKTAEYYAKMQPYLMRSVIPAPGDQTTSDTQRPLPMVALGLAKAGSPLLPATWPSDESPQLLAGRRFSGRADLRRDPFTAYNVVGVVRGADPRFNKTFVAFGAHYDHVGIQSGMKPDSIANGADDDGSGSVAMLAIAKSMTSKRPRRSALFVWHTGEEKGLLGSAHFTNRPTVPIDSIVAHFNMDMIGRRGGPTENFDSRVNGESAANRVYVIGPSAAPNNQSKALGAILDTVNARQLRPLELDRALDSPTHPERYYFRSDHYNYAQKGIPILFFSTGFHEDYHKVSDEPAKIDYEKMARIASLMLELGTTVANREARPR